MLILPSSFVYFVLFVGQIPDLGPDNAVTAAPILPGCTPSIAELLPAPNDGT